MWWARRCQTSFPVPVAGLVYFNLSKKIRLYFSCESSAGQRIHLKHQVWFSLKNNEKIFINVAAAVVIGALRVNTQSYLELWWGWSGGAMVLGRLPVPGRPACLGWSRARAYCACSRRGWGLFGHFFVWSIISLFFLPLWETARYRLKYCLKGRLSPKQPTNQPGALVHSGFWMPELSPLKPKS